MSQPKFVINGFCFQHTPGSDYSHFEPTGGGDPVQSLLKVVEAEWKPEFDATERHVLVPLDADAMSRHGKFFTGCAVVTDKSRLVCQYAQRTGAVPGELPFLQARILGGSKVQVSNASIVVYNENVLEPTEKVHQGRTLNGQFHIITLLCNIDSGKPPMPPVTLMRNHCALVAPGTPESIGGTAYNATPEDYLTSIRYWRNKLFCTKERECPPLQADCAAAFAYRGLAPVDTHNMMLEAVFAPVYPGGVSFVQFRAPNAFSLKGTGKTRPASPYELACQHAKFLGLPEGEGVSGIGYVPTAEDYRTAVLLYSNHVHCEVQ